MTRVVVGTDYSPEAQAAARVGARIAGAPGDLLVLHVISPGAGVPTMSAPGLGGLPVPGETLMGPALDPDAVDDGLARWCADAGVPGARHAAAVGMPGRELARAAKEWGAPLVVIGASGKTRMERMLLGTSAPAVLNDATTHVLIARAPPERFERAIVAWDLEDEATLVRAREALAAWSPETSDILVTHVCDRTEPNVGHGRDAAERKLVDATARVFDGRASAVTLDGRAADEIMRLAESRRADLLVVGRQRGGALDRWMLGSVSARLAERAPCSLLVLARA